MLAQLAAAHLVVACQALDLRALHKQYFDSMRGPLEELVKSSFILSASSEDRKHEASSEAAGLATELWKPLQESFEATFILSSEQRFSVIANSLRGPLLDIAKRQSIGDPVKVITDFVEQLGAVLCENWTLHRDAYFAHGDASALLGRGSSTIYSFVRRGLGVPFLYVDRIRTPEPERIDSGAAPTERPKTMTIGDYIFVVYEAIKDGRLAKISVEVLRY